MRFFSASLFVALGGMFGATLRFWVSEIIHIFFERSFPLGTLTVNVLGSFLMGFLSVYLLSRFPLNENIRAFLLIGTLGAFTTFSTFSLDAITLIQSGKLLTCIAYIITSLTLCIFATTAGIVLAS